MRIPQKGIRKDELFKKMEAYRAGDMNWRDGRVWAYVYDPGREAEDNPEEAVTDLVPETRGILA